VPSALAKYVVVFTGDTLMLLVNPAAVPPQVLVYQRHDAPVPRVPPEMLIVVLFPLQIVEVPVIELANTELLKTVKTTESDMNFKPETVEIEHLNRLPFKLSAAGLMESVSLLAPLNTPVLLRLIHLPDNFRCQLYVLLALTVSFIEKLVFNPEQTDFDMGCTMNTAFNSQIKKNVTMVMNNLIDFEFDNLLIVKQHFCIYSFV